MVDRFGHKYRYAVDADDVITLVGANWLAFARENGAPELTEQVVIGRSLWDFINGATTIRLYRSILEHIRTSTASVVVPFRCDSPTLRRYMRLEITRQRQDGIRFDGVLEQVKLTGRLSLLDPGVSRSRDALTLCSCCKQAFVEPYGWLEIEDAVARLHLLEEECSPRLLYEICPNCLAVAHTAPSLPPT